MKKTLVIALLIGLLTLGLSACSDLLPGGRTPATQPPAQETAEPTATATARPTAAATETAPETSPAA